MRILFLPSMPILFAFCFLAFQLLGPKANAAAFDEFAIHKDQIRSGDVIFKGSDYGLWAVMARNISESDEVFTHVGVIVVENETYFVIHADTGAAGENAVVKVPIGDFLEDANRIGIYSPAMGIAARNRLLAFLYSTVEEKIPFDNLYSLESADAMYCTELIWRGMLAAMSVDPMPIKSNYGNFSFISIDDLRTISGTRI